MSFLGSHNLSLPGYLIIIQLSVIQDRFLATSTDGGCIVFTSYQTYCLKCLFLAILILEIVTFHQQPVWFATPSLISLEKQPILCSIPITSLITFSLYKSWYFSSPIIDIFNYDGALCISQTRKIIGAFWLSPIEYKIVTYLCPGKQEYLR